MAWTGSTSRGPRDRSTWVGGPSNGSEPHTRDIALRRRAEQATVLATEFRRASTRVYAGERRPRGCYACGMPHRHDVLGTATLLGGPAPVFVQALVNSSVYFMDVARAKRLAQADAAVACALAAETVHRLYCAYEELAGNTFATVKQRILRHLLDLTACEPDGRLVAPSTSRISPTALDLFQKLWRASSKSLARHHSGARRRDSWKSSIRSG
jgi:hypothetical protein